MKLALNEIKPIEISRDEHIPKMSIDVTIQKFNNPINYRCRSVFESDPVDGISKICLEKEHVAEIKSTMKLVSKEFTKSRLPTNIYRRIRDIMYPLTDQLLPNNMLNMISELEEGDVIHIYSNENTIPWELLVLPDEDRLLTEKCFVIRKPVRNTAKLSTHSDSSENEVKYVVPVVGPRTRTSQRKIEKELNLLLSNRSRSTGKIDVKTAPSNRKYYSVDDLLKLKNVAYWDYFCHSEAIDNTGNTFCLRISDEDDGKVLIGTINRLIMNNSLVLLNACSSSVANLHYECSYNYCTQFYLKGASAVIGTIAPIRISAAERFNTIFNEAILLNNNSYGDAFLIARQHLLENDDPSWILYSFWGNYEKSLVPRQNDMVVCGL